MKYYYVYQITDVKRNKYYIGSRTSSVPPEEDLGYIYFSSSPNKKFIKEQLEKSDQFIYEIIRTFPTIEEALSFESDMIKDNDALNSNKYYNGRTKLSFTTTSRPTKDVLLYLGKLIKFARKERGVTQTELADRLNVGRVTIYKIENGNNSVSIGTVFEACFVLGIPILGGDRNHINNLSRMISYINKLIPEGIPNKNINFNDDF